MTIPVTVSNQVSGSLPPGETYLGPTWSVTNFGTKEIHFSVLATEERPAIHPKDNSNE